MGSILGDFFRGIGSGVDKLSEGEIWDGVVDIVGGTLGGAGRTVGFAAKTIGDTASAVGDVINDIFGDGEISQDEITEEELPCLGFIAHIGMLAKMAKLDGRVSREEIQFMESLISEWNLQGDGIENVQKIFREAKDSDQDIFELAQIFALANSDNEVRLDVYIQLWQMALADRAGAEEKLVVLRNLPGALGLDDRVFDAVVSMLQEANENGNGQQTLEECFAILGCPPNASDAEVRRCYKEKMAQYHPDAISGKNLAPGFVEFANQQSARINAAYEVIKQERGMR